MGPRVLSLLLLGALAIPAAAQEGGTELPSSGSALPKTPEGRSAVRSAKLRQFAHAWLGTPYLWGGTTKNGIDCSGYLREMFRTVYNIELPRTTKEQIDMGIEVRLDPHNLGKGFEPGDLFFYVDSVGVPSHVVTYIGGGQFTHSLGGRGVLIEGMKALWGRRIVGRRVLVPALPGAKGDYGPIPAAGPIRAEEVPCPPSIHAQPEEVRRFKSEPLADFGPYKNREICEWKALKQALLARPGNASADNATRIDQQIEWLEKLEAVKEELGPR
ncbi:MAG: C40 family peptidase [Myxococcota bacterium]